jgi:hypothetical protein
VAFESSFVVIFKSDVVVVIVVVVVAVVDIGRRVVVGATRRVEPLPLALVLLLLRG